MEKINNIIPRIEIVYDCGHSIEKKDSYLTKHHKINRKHQERSRQREGLRMARLKFYQEEYEVYADYWITRYNPQEAGKILKKLARHFKVSIDYQFTSYSTGYASYRRFKITLPKDNIALAMICHEIGHLLAVKTYGMQEGKGHNKKLKRVNKRIFTYARKYLEPDHKCYDKLEDIRLARAEKRGFKGWYICPTCKLRMSGGYNIQDKIYHLNCIPLTVIK